MDVGSAAQSVEEPEIRTRPARPGDDQVVARLIYSSWPGRFGYLAGGERRALALVLAAVARGGNVASRDLVWVAELDRGVAGALAAFPADERHRRHRRLLLLALRWHAAYEWPGLIRHYRMALRRAKDLPARTLYMDVLTTDQGRGVTVSLLDTADSLARSRGLDGLGIHLHPASAHARALYEAEGFRVVPGAGRDDLLLLHRPLGASG